MRRHLGRWVLGLAVGGWLVLLGGLWAGGIDPAPKQYNTLRAMMGFGLVAECLTVPIGLVALAIGPHRVAALAGLILSAAYFLYFTGMTCMFFASRG